MQKKRNFKASVTTKNKAEQAKFWKLESKYFLALNTQIFAIMNKKILCFSSSNNNKFFFFIKIALY
jgi:hypothetical protein